MKLIASTVLCLLTIFFSTLVTNNCSAQIQDSITLETAIATSFATYEDSDGLHLKFGTADGNLNHLVFDKNGIVKHEKDNYTMPELAATIKNLREKDVSNVIDQDASLHSVNVKGSGLAGYFAPYEFQSASYVDKKKVENNIPVPIEQSKSIKWEKYVNEILQVDGHTMAQLVLGKGIKKDKTRKKNQFYEFEVFIYSYEKGEVLRSAIKTKWGCVPHHVGILRNQEGALDGYYVEFALGGGAEGLSKQNKEAPKNARYLTILDKEGTQVKDFEVIIPIKVNKFLMGDEFYIDNVLRIDGKVHAYMKTFNSSLKPDLWLPDYFYYAENSESVLTYEANIDFKNFRLDETPGYYGSTEGLQDLTDLSDGILLENGNLFSIGTSDCIRFKYMITKTDGSCHSYGKIGAMFPNVTGNNFNFKIKDYSETHYALVTYTLASSSNLVNDYIFIDKRDGSIRSLRPENTTNDIHRFSPFKGRLHKICSIERHIIYLRQIF